MKKLIDKLDFFKKWKPFALQKTSSGLPSGSVVTNLPGNAGDMGSIPGPGRSHMARNNQAHVPQLSSLFSVEPMRRTRWSLRTLEPVFSRERRRCSQKPERWN